MNPWFDDVQTAYWLIDYTLRWSALLVLAAAAALLWRRSSAAVRHRIWSLGLVGALVLPLAGSIAPPLALPWWLRPEPAAPGRADIGEVHPLAVQAALDRGPRAYADPPIAANDVPADRALDPAGPARAPATVAAVARRKAISILGHPSAAIVLAAVWFAGAVVAAIPLAVGAMQSWRFVHGGREVDDPCWLALFDELTAQLGFRRRVRLIVDERVAVPLAAGVLWPVIVLPNAHAWDASLRRNVLLHELAHVRRWDVRWQLLGRAACVALWHHPLAWLALRAMRAERELACDDFALSAGARASDYAGHLLSVALEASDVDRIDAGLGSPARPG